MLLNQMTIQNQCYELIENDINIFFSSCLKSALAYSHLAVKEVKCYNYENFERFVLAESEVRNVVQCVLQKLNVHMQQDPNAKDLSFTCTSSGIMDVKSALDGTMQNFRTTQGVTDFCEKFLNQSVSRGFKNILPIPMANKAVGKLKLGSKLLGELNGKTQIERQQKELYNQIHGLLINMKTNLINQLKEYVQISFASVGDKQVLEFNAIA